MVFVLADEVIGRRISGGYLLTQTPDRDSHWVDDEHGADVTFVDQMPHRPVDDPLAVPAAPAHAAESRDSVGGPAVVDRPQRRLRLMAHRTRYDERSSRLGVRTTILDGASSPTVKSRQQRVEAVVSHPDAPHLFARSVGPFGITCWQTYCSVLRNDATDMFDIPI